MKIEMMRHEYSTYLLNALNEKSPWILDVGAGLFIYAFRNLKLRGHSVKIGLLLRTESSLERGGTYGRVDPFVAIQFGDGWKVIDSIWLLGRIAGRGTSAAFGQDPLIMVRPGPSFDVAKRVVANSNLFKDVFETYDNLDDLWNEESRGTAAVVGERRPEEILKLARRIPPLLPDVEMEAGGRINIFLGRWNVSEFSKEFSLPLEAIRVLEEQAQQEFDKYNELVRVDEFVALREETFQISPWNLKAEVKVELVLDWISYLLNRRQTGESFMGEIYREMGRISLDDESAPLDDPAKWKDLTYKGVNRIISMWMKANEPAIREEPELNKQSRFLERLIRSVGGEYSRVSGSLEGYF